MNLIRNTDFPVIFDAAVMAISEVNRYKYRPELEDYASGPRRWFSLLIGQFDLHPVVRHIVYKEMIRPVDWQLLLLEWPHVSVDNDSQIAYTRNEAAGLDFPVNGSTRQTRTSIGKYLSRHWPHVPDHIRRDWAGRHTTSKCTIWDTKEGIISSIELGPRSCMKSTYGNIPFGPRDNRALVQWHTDKETRVAWHYHPYSVYAPERGWAAAVRVADGDPLTVLGRAIVHTKLKVFVRSYLRGETESSTSYTDERLEAWLREQGYEKRYEWPHGVTFDKVDHPNGGLMMPYLDGNERRCEEMDDCVMLTGDGYACDNTDGTFDGANVIGECEDCGDRVFEGDDNRIWVGRHEDLCVCGNCANNYRYVYGYRGNEYYVHEDSAVRVRGEWYDVDNLPDCIRELNNGDYEHEDYCVYSEANDCYYLLDDAVQCESDDYWYHRDSDDIVEIDGNWYRKDDDNVVECEDGEYRMKDDCWEDAHSGNWYSNEEDPIILNGNDYHPDTLKNALSDAGEL